MHASDTRNVAQAERSCDLLIRSGRGAVPVARAVWAVWVPVTVVHGRETQIGDLILECCVFCVVWVWR